jgi:hypothetical protein
LELQVRVVVTPDGVQLALPDAAMPVATWPLGHCVGVDAKAVAAFTVPEHPAALPFAMMPVGA